MRNGKVVILLDAKYQDLWEKSLSRDMLYKLSVYAVSGIGNKTATILYLSDITYAKVQKIDVNNPISNSKIATVILKPINLRRFAELVSLKNLDFSPLRSFVQDFLGLQTE